MTDRRHGGGAAIVFDEPGCAGFGNASLFAVLDSGRREIVPLQLDHGATDYSYRFAENALFEEGREELAQSLRTGTQTEVKHYCRVAPSHEWDPEELTEFSAGFGGYQAPNLKHKALNLPAAFTYLGQFIAHELSNLGSFNDSLHPKAPRTAAFDLDSLFGASQDGLREADRAGWIGGIGVGRTYDANSSDRLGSWNDLPRDNDGNPLVPELRNDDNLAVAQIHVLLSKFHQVIVKASYSDHEDIAEHCPDCEAETTRHVQAMILNDYLYRLCDPVVYADIKANGRRIIHPRKLAQGQPFIIPIEFAVAAFRVGHSMIRQDYPRWPSNETGESNPFDFFQHTMKGGAIFSGPYGGLGRLTEKWLAPWRRMIWRNPSNVADAIEAQRIDTMVAADLADIPAHLLNEFWQATASTHNDLIAVTLHRHWFYELATTKGVLEAIYGSGCPETKNHSYLGSLESLPSTNFTGCKEMPLYAFCLLESEQAWVSSPDESRLGPVTSRLVMETIHASVEAAKTSIINEDGTWSFDGSQSLGTTGDFDFLHLLDVANTWSPRDLS